MSTAAEIVEELRLLGSESIKKVLLKHGAREPFFGVKVEDLKKIQKRIKKDYELALDLYATGNYDAMYLAGLIADDERMTREDLQRWVDGAYTHGISGCTVAWVASGSRHGRELALEWIDSPRENTTAAGWSTLGCLVAVRPDSELDLEELTRLIERVAATIHDQPNRARYAMNSFLMAAGIYVPALTDLAVRAAEETGLVSVDMGETACKVPYAPDYIKKAQERGSIGKKRKSAKC
jgi:3-methyladenine DNA glycosylase AlkD